MVYEPTQYERSSRAIREGRRLAVPVEEHETALVDTSGIKVTVEVVTPDLAATWLLANTHNRAMKDKAIARYAADIRAGRWDFNGESIKFDHSGRLLDGQNRLRAIILAGVAITTLVVRGLPSDSQDTVDVGVPRRLADVLRLRGEVSTIDLAAGIKALWLFERDPRDMSATMGPSIHEALALLDRHPALRESVRAAETLRKTVGLRGSTGIALHYITTSLDAGDAEAFWLRLAAGTDLAPDDPIYHLRSALIADRVKARQRMTFTRMWALTVKAWNAYREGTRIKQLTWRPGGANPEKFPVPA